MNRAVSAASEPHHREPEVQGENGEIHSVASLIDRLRTNIASVLFGKPQTIDSATVCLLAEGHALIEDVPGIGKTLLARALAASLGCTFHRIQFTPDLLPSDILGTSVFQQASGEFVFKPGPLLRRWCSPTRSTELRRALRARSWRR